MEGTKDSNVKRFCSQNILVILGFSSIIAVIALIAVGVSQNKPLPENFKYGIVLDAGSTHTNLYIYKWPAEKNNNTGVVQQVEECIVKGPGISKFSNKIHALETYLDTCLDKCKKVIPKSLHPETPVYLGATAGMRLLSMKDEQLAHSVLDEVAKSISDYPFEFRGARILTGQEEGAYGWITINYLLGKFVQKSKWLGLLTGGRERTFGALDLGGASTQITFEPESLPIEGPENAVQFRLYGKDYTVYTHSFLCYGKNEALQLKLAKDIEASSKGILRDPCFHLGFEMFVNVSKLYSSPCARRYEKTLPFDKFQVQGTGNYQQCGQSVLELFNTSYCPYSHCAFNGIPLPPVKGKFGAFSAFQYVMQFLNMTSKHVTTEAMMNEAMERYCSRTWQEIKESYPEVHEGFLSEYCFAGTYILTLLLQGYHFTESSFKDIEFMGEIEGSSAGWTLGYMLNLTNIIPAEQPLTVPLSHPTYVFLMVLFSLILAVAIILGLVIFKNPSYFWKEAV